MKILRMLLILSNFGLTSCLELYETLQAYGFTVLEPPSTLMKPGTIVWIKHKDPFQGGIICEAAESLGAGFKPLQSPTLATLRIRNIGNQFALGGVLLDIVRVQPLFKNIKQITVSLAHPLIYTISDWDVRKSIGGRDPMCTAAIRARERAEFRITMVASALMADALYRVEWQQGANLSMEVKQAILSDLGVQLDLKADVVTQDSISGHGLYWGIIDDQYLASIDNTPDIQPKRLLVEAWHVGDQDQPATQLSN